MQGGEPDSRLYPKGLQILLYHWFHTLQSLLNQPALLQFAFPRQMFHIASCGAGHWLDCVVGSVNKSVAMSSFTCAMTATTTTAFTVWGISPGVGGSAMTVSLLCKSYLKNNYTLMSVMTLQLTGMAGRLNRRVKKREKRTVKHPRTEVKDVAHCIWYNYVPSICL